MEDEDEGEENEQEDERDGEQLWNGDNSFYRFLL